MVALIVVLIIVILSMAHFYLKSGALVSFAAFVSAILGIVVAFGYYEVLADTLLARGIGGQWAPAATCVLLFVLTFAVLRTAADFIFGQDVELGTVITRTAAVVCGILTGLIISGVVLVALAMAPIPAKWPYARMGDGETAVSSVRLVSRPLIRADGFVTALFSWISRGSLSSNKSFAVYQDDFLNRIHLNKYKAGKDVYTVAGRNAVTVPRKGVRTAGDPHSDLTIVRVEINNRDIKSGGAQAGKGDVSFMLGQVRLICKEKGQRNTRGAGKAIYPEGYGVRPKLERAYGPASERAATINEKVFEKSTLDEVVTLTREDFRIGNKSVPGRVDFAFKVPPDMEAVLLEFKLNVAVEVPETVESTPEVERQLNSVEWKSPGSGVTPVEPILPGDPNM